MKNLHFELRSIFIHDQPEVHFKGKIITMFIKAHLPSLIHFFFFIKMVHPNLGSLQIIFNLRILFTQQVRRFFILYLWFIKLIMIFLVINFGQEVLYINRRVMDTIIRLFLSRETVKFNIQSFDNGIIRFQFEIQLLMVTPALFRSPRFHNFRHFLKYLMSPPQILVPVDIFIFNHMVQKPFLFILSPVAMIFFAGFILSPASFSGLVYVSAFSNILVVGVSIK